jgi:hypothetical protein
LFRSASETIKEIAQDPKHLGAEVGSIGVLHTWAQNLIDHPHVHFIVPAGGLSADGKKWIRCKDGFFLPVRVLSKVFRGKFLGLLDSAYQAGKLRFPGKIEHLRAPHIFQELLSQCASKEFVVYAKEPFSGPKQVISYLGQYTHRIAISNYRLVSLDGDQVSFKIRDPDDPKKKKLMTLHVKEFMRRFLLHVLPKGFVRIRHFGLLGSRSKAQKLRTLRALLGVKEVVKVATSESWRDLLLRLTGIDSDQCPGCKKGQMVESWSFCSRLQPNLS